MGHLFDALWDLWGGSIPELESSDAGDGIIRLWGINTMPADTLVPKVAKASTGMVFAM